MNLLGDNHKCQMASCAGKVQVGQISCLQRFFYALNVVDFVNGVGDPNSANGAASMGG